MTILKELIMILRGEFKKLPDSRGKKHRTYAIEDIAMSAYAMFYFQNPSWLDFQRNMQNRTGRSNARSLFDIDKIPSDNHIRDILDDIEVEKLQPLFNKIYKMLLKKEVIKEYQYFNNTLLVLLDGTYYHSSKKIHCEHCQRRKKEDSKGNEYIQYYHSAITPIIAHPNNKSILPLLPEMISNKDGDEKQDCEINASKRWLDKDHLIAEYFKLAILGDDLFCKTSLILDIRQKGYNYIFVCKESSHKKLYEMVQLIDNIGNLDTKIVTKNNKKTRKKETYHYQFVNEVPLTGDKDSIDVNWCSVKVTDERGDTIYSNAFVTDYVINGNNIEKIIEAGRCRWKIENENNNILKNGGYHLNHNFGHGKKGLSELLFVFNILSFLTHTICLKYEQGYQELYELIGKRTTFFGHINTFTTFFYISDWDLLWQKMIEGYVDGLHLD